MVRAVVVLPTSSYRTEDFLSAAAALGVELAVASEEDPPLPLGNRFVRIDCADPKGSAERIVELAVATPVDAVVAADDAGVVIAALAATELGLPGTPPDAAAATRDKLAMRRLLDAGEVTQPPFAAVGPDDDPAAVGLGYPAVLKPRALSASQGVIRVDDAAAARAAADRIRAILGDPTATLVAEAFIPGTEISVEGILWSGELEILATFDKPDPLDGPFFEETMFITPSRHPPEVLAAAHALTARAARHLGLTEGPVHAELRLDGDRPVVIEVAARTIGGLCGRSLQFGLLGTPLEALVLRHALGMRKTGLHLRPGASGVLMIPIPAAGTLGEVRGLDEARGVPGVTEIELTIPTGSRLVPLPEGDRYLGFIFARGPEPDDVEAALRAAHAALSFVIEP